MERGAQSQILVRILASLFDLAYALVEPARSAIDSTIAHSEHASYKMALVDVAVAGSSQQQQVSDSAEGISILVSFAYSQLSFAWNSSFAQKGLEPHVHRSRWNKVRVHGLLSSTREDLSCLREII